jgi:hypothetical protein
MNFPLEDFVRNTAARKLLPPASSVKQLAFFATLRRCVSFFCSSRSCSPPCPPRRSSSCRSRLQTAASAAPRARPASADLPTDQRFPLCISEQASGRDFDATLRFKPISGSRDQVAGFMFRAQSANDYYVVRANARDNSVRLYRMDKGKRSQLGMKEAPVTLGQWHSLRVIAVSDRIEVALDGKKLFDVTDRSLMQPGPVGVWSQGDSVTHYGSLLIGPPPSR